MHAGLMEGLTENRVNVERVDMGEEERVASDSEETVTADEEEAVRPASPEVAQVRRSARERSRPAYLDDYVTYADDENE